MNAYRITEVATPAAVAFRWESDGTRFELAWLRGDRRWLLGVNRGNGWMVTPAPGVEQTTKLKDARRIAAEFINGKGKEG